MKETLPELPDDLQGQVTSLRTVLVGLINSSLETNAKIDELAKRLNDSQISQMETDERLNTVILMAEKFFSGENGDSKNKN